MFDEAHVGVLRANGLYKAFADLITSDGYEIIPNRAQFSPKVLEKGDVLIIVKCRGKELDGLAGACSPRV